MRLSKCCIRGGGWILFAFAIAANSEPPERQLVPSAVDQSGVDTFNREFTNAIRTMNNQAVLSLWEDDGVALLPDTAPVRGKGAMATMLQSISSAHPKARMEHFTKE